MLTFTCKMKESYFTQRTPSSKSVYWTWYDAVFCLNFKHLKPSTLVWNSGSNSRWQDPKLGRGTEIEVPLFISWWGKSQCHSLQSTWGGGLNPEPPLCKAGTITAVVMEWTSILPLLVSQRESCGVFVILLSEDLTIEVTVWTEEALQHRGRCRQGLGATWQSIRSHD